MSDTNVIDRFFGALEAGDASVVRGCFAPGGTLWHSFDGVVMGPADVEKTWQAMAANFAERIITDVRRQATPTGFVQQHLMVVRPKDGPRKAWPVCIVVRIEDGLIARLDEYIDRAGSFDPGEGALATPGF